MKLRDRAALWLILGAVGASPLVVGAAAAAILTDHPRLHLTNGRLAELQTNACYDANGNPIPNCSPTRQWTEFKNIMDNYPSRLVAWEWAMAYLITKDSQYLALALGEADIRVAGGWQRQVTLHSRFLYVREALRDIALTFDWIYDELSDARKQSYMDYMNLLMYLVWNDDEVSQSIYDVGGHGTKDPGNNFHWTFILATTYAGLAMYGEHPGNFTHEGTTYPFKLPDFAERSFDNMIDFVYGKLDFKAIPNWLTTYGKGGGWHEGTQYGPSSKRHMFEAFMALRDAGGRDYFSLIEFPRESIYFHIYATQPGGGVLYSGGKAGRDITMSVFDYDRHLMLLAARGYKGTIDSEYAQYWLNTVQPDMDSKNMNGLNFLLSEPQLPERTFDDLPLSYFAEGYGWINSRSSWQNDAVSVSFISADKAQEHQHNDQNAFQIFKGSFSSNSYRNWIVTDVQPFTDGKLRKTKRHNTIRVNSYCQRAGKGTGKITKVESGSNYAYMVGDASDAYYQNQKSECYSSGGDKQLQTYLREIVHIFPGYVAVFDRVTPMLANADVRDLFHFANQPQVQGNQVEASSGDGRVFQTVLLPETNNISVVEETSTWRIEVMDPAVPDNYLFLNVFQITESDVTAAPASVSRVSSATNNMVGAEFDTGTESFVVLFSSDPNGAAPSGSIIYEVGLNPSGRHLLFGLVPGAEYSVAVERQERKPGQGSTTLVISDGAGYTASGSGVLEFELNLLESDAQRRLVLK